MEKSERMLANAAGMAMRCLAFKATYRIEIMDGERIYHHVKSETTLVDAIAAMISLYRNFENRQTVLKMYGQEGELSGPIVTLDKGFLFPDGADKPMYLLVTSQSGYDADLYPSEEAREEAVKIIMPDQDPAYDDVIEVNFWASGEAGGESVFFDIEEESE